MAHIRCHISDVPRPTVRGRVALMQRIPGGARTTRTSLRARRLKANSDVDGCHRVNWLRFVRPRWPRQGRVVVRLHVELHGAGVEVHVGKGVAQLLSHVELVFLWPKRARRARAADAQQVGVVDVIVANRKPSRILACRHGKLVHGGSDCNGLGAAYLRVGASLLRVHLVLELAPKAEQTCDPALLPGAPRPLLLFSITRNHSRWEQRRARSDKGRSPPSPRNPIQEQNRCRPCRRDTSPNMGGL